MKKRFWILIVLGIVVITNLTINFDRIMLDGISGEISSLAFPPDTKYSEGYSHEKFRQIEIGMTEEQVVEIIGKPLTIWNPYKPTKYTEKRHYVGFQYSESPTSVDYRLRQVYFDNGIVAEKIDYYYFD